MDPLILILEELEKVRSDIEKLEMTLFTMENDPSHHHHHHHHVVSSDTRYIRLVNEKEMLIKNLCEIRKDLCNKGIFDDIIHDTTYNNDNNHELYE
jgi:hypothetical protein